ncbi:MAG: hypothetical protein JXB88_19945 [Spirochaetales bacterium]|nr:hypothetical protein [Spirochaetales bacterium]
MKKSIKLFFAISLVLSIPVFSIFSQVTGDVNKDSSVDIIDALITAQYYVGLDPVVFFPEFADVNCDGETALDNLPMIFMMISLILL